MFLGIRMYLSADVSWQSLFIKVKERKSFHKHQLYSNVVTKMIIATSFECRAPVASLKKTGSLVPYHLIIDFFLIPAILISLSMVKNKCIWLRLFLLWRNTIQICENIRFGFLKRKLGTWRRWLRETTAIVRSSSIVR